MNWVDHSLLWNEAFVKIIDIRYTNLTHSEPFLSYNLPTSGFLFSERGGACILLNEVEYELKPMHLLHAGKGMRMNIQVTEQSFDFYLILYKAKLANPSNRRLDQLMIRCNPFRLTYCINPKASLNTYTTIQLMHKHWGQPNASGQLQVKGLFYMFINELLSELEENKPIVSTPNPVIQTIRYLNEHYKEAITVQEMADRWNINVRSFTRLFRTQIGKSPLDYLIQLRMDQAQELLLRTEASLPDIAAAVGYSDEYYFGRMFKKHKGISPIAYRNQKQQQDEWSYPPFLLSDLSIATGDNHRYIGNDNYYHHSREDVLSMHSSTKPSLAAIMLLCLTVILTACQTDANTNGNMIGGTSPSPTITTNTASGATRVVSTMKGDITIPADPKRIVGMPIEFRELLFAMNITPVASFNEHTEFPTYLGDSFKDVIKLGGGIELPFEKILTTEPDLIIGSDWMIEKGYESLTKIAPTIMLPDQNWRLTLNELGRVLDKQEAAEQAIANYDSAAAAAKEKIQTIVGDHTFMMMMVREKQFSIVGETSPRGEILHHELGLKPVAAYPQGEAYLEISLEKIPEYNPDYLLLQLFDESDETRATYENLLNSNLYKNMTAVKNNQVFIIGEENGGREWHLFGFSPLANQYGIREIVKAFEDNKSS
ncbi:AraC family transcriptional regulator [Paenibacillus sinopodophylli]|uniref:AraC family transcriptional regulator n=1 Tax=Paenibacillus sinopodophylli TaxID=1837342 RepID=UPI00110D1E44|nr:AraC family transcriptional regulator [Paenibacillus sinopodophylli]